MSDSDRDERERGPTTSLEDEFGISNDLSSGEEDAGVFPDVVKAL